MRSMRAAVLWMLVLAGLPCVAYADGNPTGGIDPAGGIESDPFGGQLDLHLDAAQLPRPAAAPPPLAVEPAPDERYIAAPTPVHERGLSFGVEVKPRGRDSRALVGQHDEPGLQDDVERFIEHSTLGLRGTYRF
jgi:hypothetical protein